MICFTDNDIIHKLAALDLIEEALEVLDDPDLRVLDTARFKFLTKNPAKGRNKYGADVYDRIHAFLDRATTVVEAPEEDDVERLTAVLDIDPGEALLIWSASRGNDARLATGDKRCLTALHGAATCTDLVESLEGRVVCLEQLLLGVIDRCGFDSMLPKIVAGADCDKTISAVFGSGMRATEPAVREGLASYVNDLRDKTGTLLGEVPVGAAANP